MTSSKKKMPEKPVKKPLTSQKVEEKPKKPDLVVEKQLDQPFLAEPLPAEQPKQPKSPEEVVVTPSEVIKPGKEEPVWDYAMYKAFANSVHQTVANFIQLFTKDKVVIGQDKIEMLDKCGVALLKKWDKTGFIERYGLELAYGLTLLDIGSQVYIELQRQKHEEKPKSPETPGAKP